MNLMLLSKVSTDGISKWSSIRAIKGQIVNQNRFFGGFASFARPLSSRVVCVVVYGKVPWLSLHAKYRTCKAKQAAAPFFSRSQHTHNKRKEKPATQRASSQVLFSFFTSKKLLLERIQFLAPSNWKLGNVRQSIIFIFLQWSKSLRRLLSF